MFSLWCRRRKCLIPCVHRVRKAGDRRFGYSVWLLQIPLLQSSNGCRSLEKVTSNDGNTSPRVYNSFGGYSLDFHSCVLGLTPLVGETDPSHFLLPGVKESIEDSTRRYMGDVFTFGPTQASRQGMNLIRLHPSAEWRWVAITLSPLGLTVSCPILLHRLASGRPPIEGWGRSCGARRSRVSDLPCTAVRPPLIA